MVTNRPKIESTKIIRTCPAPSSTPERVFRAVTCGKPFAVEDEFLVVDPPYQLVQTWRYDCDRSGRVTTSTWRFDAIEYGTLLTVRHEGFGDAYAACANHVEGRERVLGWLSLNFGAAT